MSILPYDSKILIFGSLKEKMNREGKGGGYIEKEFLLLKRNKTEKEDYIWRRIFFSEENKKKNEEHIWRRKICFLQGRRLIVKEKDENIWRRKMCFLRRRRITEKEKLDHLQEAGQSG